MVSVNLGSERGSWEGGWAATWIGNQVRTAGRGCRSTQIRAGRGGAREGAGGGWGRAALLQEAEGKALWKAAPIRWDLQPRAGTDTLEVLPDWLPGVRLMPHV